MAQSDTGLSAISNDLEAHMRIQREKAVEALVDGVTKEQFSTNQVEQALTDTLAKSEPWEALHGGCMAITKLVDSEQALSDGFIQSAAPVLTKLLSHSESRVREASGAALGSLCKVAGVDVYTKYAKDTILSSIRDNLERDVEPEAIKAMQDKLGIESSSVNDIFHESAGWKTLETGCKALHHVTKACGAKFGPQLDKGLIDLVFKAIKHTNRFVRETGYYVCNEFVGVAQEDVADQLDLGLPYADFRVLMADQLAVGLADNWSQVRMASCVATRAFLQSMSEESREDHLPLLLPRLCINRYYVAAGVRIYSQDSWKVLFGDQGRKKVEKYIQTTVEFYIHQAQADNHAVREAACACIAELGLKIDRECIKPHVATLLQCLNEAFEDESWPVRDAACIASGRFLGAFVDESRPLLPKFLDLFFHHVGDNIWSVRENAAVALGNVAKSFDEKVVDQIFAKLGELLPQAKEQTEDSQVNSGLENVTQFGVARPSSPSPMASVTRVRFSFGQADPLHTNQQLYSCGSLAPKLKRKGGCMDCAYTRPQQKWERSDGAIYLVRELAPIDPERTSCFLSELVELAKLRGFKHHCHLLETLWNQFPSIANSVGKKAVKQHIQELIPSLAYSMQSEHQLSKVAAQNCVVALCRLLGPTIVQGRVDMVDPGLMDVFGPHLHR
eukprot:TRINITY_DN5932_c0_g1_i1.p1 TRINITY_DN5932_c0_g1~~TRINITY_DN5932_c0_g1_i1.p1  ORF type:complete len:673 (+),score=171.76 TRINITY_DN5932_c0_g1_i1:2-2020(+)